MYFDSETIMPITNAPIASEKPIHRAKTAIPKAKWSTANEFWSGGRPLSGDGKPLIGKTAHPRVHVNSGHGMWGVTLAPVSAKLISDLILNKGTISKDLDPLR